MYWSVCDYQNKAVILNVFRERPFNLKGGGGGYVFFLKNILIPKIAEKNILILVEEKN